MYRLNWTAVRFFGPQICGPKFLVQCIFFVFVLASWHPAIAEQGSPSTLWQEALKSGDFDRAVQLARGGQTPLGKLIENAKQQALHKDPLWRALLHYQSTFGGVKSQIDSPWFFQSEQGKVDSEAELNATLAAFFRSDAKAPLRLSPYCRFIARRDWLAGQLGALFDAVPVQSCPESEQFFSYLNAHTLTVVFPTSHPNSPASAFGHTLIRVDQEGQSADAKLLNMSINFAAEVPLGVSPIGYTLGGLGGAFPGTFRLLPYHMKLREYRQIDNRDTWEYPLKLSQEQVDLILRHTYEMLIAEFDYFFFSENCSYHLLGLLDVAFANDPLAQQFSLWTIPVDTIKALDKRGLVEREDFVPSTIRTLKQREQGLSESEQALAFKASTDGLEEISQELDALAPERAAEVLDTIGDYFRYSRLKEDNSAGGLNTAERQVLSRRSKLGIRTQAPAVPVPNLAPQLGHDTSRLSLGARRVDNDASRFELTYRAAYHDMRDPSIAYGTRAAIEMLKLTVARDSDDEAIFLRRFTLLSIDSIEPRRGFFKPFSWRTRIDWERASANSNHRFSFTAGGGVAYRGVKDNSPVVFAFAEFDALDDPALPKRSALQVGTRVGLHWEPRQRARFGLEWEHRELVGSRRYDSQLSAWASLSPSRNAALVFEVKQRTISMQDAVNTIGAEWRWYF